MVRLAHHLKVGTHEGVTPDLGAIFGRKAGYSQHKLMLCYIGTVARPRVYCH